MEGHAWHPGKVAQVEVPAQFVNSQDWNALPLAAVLQPFSDVADGKLDTAGDSSAFVYGLLAYHGRLIVAASVYYDADNSQVNTHAVSSLISADGRRATASGPPPWYSFPAFMIAD